MKYSTALKLGAIASVLLVSGAVYFIMCHKAPPPSVVGEIALAKTGCLLEPNAATALLARATKEASPNQAVRRNVHPLVQQILAGEGGEVEEALVAMGTLGEHEVLSVFAEMKDPKTKQRLASVLARVGAPEGIEAILKAVAKTSNEKIKKDLLLTLDNLTTEEGVSMICSLPAGTSCPLVLEAFRSTVAHAANEDTVDFLKELYEEPPSQPHQREHILAALESIKNSAAIPALERLAASEASPELASAASHALENLRGIADAQTTEPVLSELPPDEG